MASVSFRSPIGPISVHAKDNHIAVVGWRNVDNPEPTPLLRDAVSQLKAFFAGDLTEFDLPLSPEGTDFQKRVWETMYTIPYGKTWSYGELASRVGTAARAVGGACGTNPIPIIIPCHRVLAANGRSGGYSGRGGLKTKTALLDIENCKARLL
ncbi:MAG: methylated-DNA--[protein]-cysteine S-methyltransferase [Pseudomonadota bacterium]|jgi:methylated-DNA-[protein]-cysteine S-methyltransferase|nr:cysteine methyltransferase [Rhodospirillaceae bacterium]MEE2722585.1 methylated-DNA--[protein]-cysteine S-methyltransferase [Pseudomonadota bacterium]|tara:strand:+ start:28 stop:486 length:459 start_codon:yes stop_codon:yes gene_type:complete